ncbi:hypothetical protein [Gallaecimonas xiamenensis]|uniref:Uncharacterized protein n=1 Tax=Gallaecimonas xiamenensis 3-C-1 TaxID=745411 RepID=K2JD18_9GAMM|nr:hypothetical protein [Gallaecimonas xiamenensis]EKE72998.1 hypothetical protein B3C1_10292 [Gallaecimonas xiamenensis 3-C-1]
MSASAWLRALKWLVLATFLSSILHYLDNMLFFADYPEPVWINTHMIDLFWVLMTPLAPLGYLWVKWGRYRAGTLLLAVYGLCNMLTLGHYRFAPFTSISTKIHLFILLEALLGGLLVAWVLLPYCRLAIGRP